LLQRRRDRAPDDIDAEALAVVDLGLRVGPQTVLVSAPAEKVTQDLSGHGIQRVPLGDLLDATAAALADAPQA
jgi:hypothetical protein